MSYMFQCDIIIKSNSNLPFRNLTKSITREETSYKLCLLFSILNSNRFITAFQSKREVLKDKCVIETLKVNLFTPNCINKIFYKDNK